MLCCYSPQSTFSTIIYYETTAPPFISYKYPYQATLIHIFWEEEVKRTIYIRVQFKEKSTDKYKRCTWRFRWVWSFLSFTSPLVMTWWWAWPCELIRRPEGLGNWFGSGGSGLLGSFISFALWDSDTWESFGTYETTNITCMQQ